MNWTLSEVVRLHEMHSIMKPAEDSITRAILATIYWARRKSVTDRAQKSSTGDRTSRRKAWGVQSVAFPWKWCKPTVLYSNLRRSSLYIDLHDGYHRTTSQARESWCCVIYYGKVRNSSYCVLARLLYDVIVLTFMGSCVLHVSQYIGFT